MMDHYEPSADELRFVWEALDREEREREGRSARLEKLRNPRWNGVRLSTAQKSSQVVAEHAAQVVYYPDASLCKVTRELLTKECMDCGREFKVERYRSIRFDRCVMCRLVKKTCLECGAEFTVTGAEQRSSKLIECPACGADNPGQVRGEITRFSEASRRRLMTHLNMLHKDKRPLFVTLTYPDEFFEHHLDPERWRRDMRAFEHRFRRAFPEACYIWRLEVEDRKSGAHIGALFPHYHLLVFGVGRQAMRRFVVEHWHAVAGQGSEDHRKVHSHKKTVTPVLSRNGIMRYASKTIGAVMGSELAKEVQAKGGRVGRWWAIVRMDLFKDLWSEVLVYELLDKDASHYMRLFRRFLEAERLQAWRKRLKRWQAVMSKKPDNPPPKPKKPRKLRAFSLRSFTVFLDGSFLRDNLVRMLVPEGKWCYAATGRPYGKPFTTHILDEREGW